MRLKNLFISKQTAKLLTRWNFAFASIVNLRRKVGSQFLIFQKLLLLEM